MHRTKTDLAKFVCGGYEVEPNVAVDRLVSVRFYSNLIDLGLEIIDFRYSIRKSAKKFFFKSYGHTY